MKIVHFLLAMAIVGATARLSADTSNLQDETQIEQTKAIASTPIVALPSVPMTAAMILPERHIAPLTATEINNSEICRERLDHTQISSADITTVPAATTPAQRDQAAPVVIANDVTEADLAGVDLNDATFEINPDLIAPFQQEPTLTEKIKWAFAFLRMKMNLACDATGTAVSNGYDTVTIHLGKHKKAYIIGSVCVGGVLLGVWYFKAKK